MSNDSSRYIVRLDDGMVVECSSAADVAALRAEMRREAEANEIPTLEAERARRPRARRAAPPGTPTPAAPVSHANSTRWTVPHVRLLVGNATPAALKLLRTAVVMPEPITVSALMGRLKTSSGGVAQTIAKFSRDAQAIGPQLPPAIRTVGKVREKHVVFDAGFLDALKEVVSSTS